MAFIFCAHDEYRTNWSDEDFLLMQSAIFMCGKAVRKELKSKSTAKLKCLVAAFPLLRVLERIDI